MFILYGQHLGYDYVDEPQKVAIFSAEDDAIKMETNIKWLHHLLFCW